MFRASNVTSCFTNASQSQNPSPHLAASPCQKGSRIWVSCSGEIPDHVSIISMLAGLMVTSTFHHVGVNLAALSKRLLIIRSTNHWCAIHVIESSHDTTTATHGYFSCTTDIKERITGTITSDLFSIWTSL